MERNLRLLQVLRECTAVERQAVVGWAGTSLLHPWPQFISVRTLRGDDPGFPVG